MKAIKRENLITTATVSARRRLMMSVPLTGLLRVEWVMARYGQIIPCNWSQVELVSWLDMFSPLGFQVADARNVATDKFVKGDFEWLFFIDHDVVMPPNTFLKWNDYMLKGDIPIWGGIYFTRSLPSEPLIYRGIGNSYYPNWKFGDKVWCTGMGLGCHVIHRSILELAYQESPEYEVGGAKVRKVFSTPHDQYYDQKNEVWVTTGGTEDLTFYNRLRNDRILERAGWPKFQKMQNPYLCDTSIFCKHVDWDGRQYPIAGEEQAFMKK